MKIECFLNGAPLDLEKNLNRQLVVDSAILAVVNAALDLRDPETGESVKITLTPNKSGINISVLGSQNLVDEVNRRLLDQPKS